MAYSEFTTLDKVITTFDLQLEEDRDLFSSMEAVTPSDYIQQTLREYLPLATAINTEKARSEFLIAPVLAELRRQTNHKISLFSGTEFNVDPAPGLSGFCGYLISHSREQYFIKAPVIAVVEAKNENIKGGLGHSALLRWWRPRYLINRDRNHCLNFMVLFPLGRCGSFCDWKSRPLPLIRWSIILTSLVKYWAL